MAEQRDALTELVQQHVGRGKRWSTREFSARAVDPDSNWSPGKSLVAKIIAGQGYDITPQLVGAIAVGLGMPREIIAAAAHLQLIGYEEAELQSGAPAVVLRKLGASSGEPEQAVVDAWDAGQSG